MCGTRAPRALLVDSSRLRCLAIATQNKQGREPPKCAIVLAANFRPLPHSAHREGHHITSLIDPR